MALFRRRPQTIDYDELAKALSPAIARAATVQSGATYSVPTPNSPFAQTGGGVMADPLPRAANTFDSLFGAGYPLVPDPIDPLGPNGRVAPRRSQYLVAWNLQLIDRQVPWTMLRWLAEDCDVVNRCIQLTQDEQCGLEWGWSYSPQLLHEIMQETGETNSAKATAIARDKYGADLLKVQHFFESPDGDMNQTFVDWLQALLWDHLVYDGVAVYPRYNLDGSLRNLELVDASTIKLLRDNQGRIPQAPSPAYQQILYGFPRGEFQHSLDEVDDEFMGDQLAYFIRRGRNTSVYGFPQVEEVMALATTYLARQSWMRAEYTTGVTPKMIVNVEDNGRWTPEQWAFYEQAFNDRLTGQIERRQMAFFLREGAKASWAPQIDEHYKSDYDNWLISQIGSRFGRPASMLGVQAKAGLSGGKQMQGEVDQSDIYSGKALTQWLVLTLNTLAQRFLGTPHGVITATVNGGGNKEDMVQQAQADASDVGAGLRPRNEVRASRGLPLIDEPEADQLSITTGQGVTFLSGLLDAQQAAQAAAPAPGAPVPPAGATQDQGGPSVPVAPTEPAADAPAAKALLESLERGVKQAVAGEVQSLGSFAGYLDDEATKSGGLPKVLADRKTVEASIAAFYQPKLRAALKALHPGVGNAARKFVAAHKDATKAADAGSFAGAHQPETAALEKVLAALYTDAWVAGLHHATQGPSGAQIAAATQNLTVVDYADWDPGWADTSNVDSPPDALAALTAGAADIASKLAAGQMNRITTAIGSAIDSGDGSGIRPQVTDLTDNDDYADSVATQETANGAETAAMAAYDAADVQWEWVLDDGACQLCQDNADAGPYDPSDDPPPGHQGCGCASQPVKKEGGDDA